MRTSSQDDAAASRVGRLRPDTVARLPIGDFTYPLTIDNDDAAMVLYLQGANESFAERALFGLTSQILRSPYYNDLRTDQQLGYAVVVTPSVLRRDRRDRRSSCRVPLPSPAALLAADADRSSPTIAARSLRDADRRIQRIQTGSDRPPAREGQKSRRSQRSATGATSTSASRSSIRANRSPPQIAKIDQTGFARFYDRLLELAQRQRLVIYNHGKFTEIPRAPRSPTSVRSGRPPDTSRPRAAQRPASD